MTGDGRNKVEDTMIIMILIMKKVLIIITTMIVRCKYENIM